MLRTVVQWVSLAAVAVAAALLLSVLLSETLQPLPIYAQMHLYAAIFIAARFGGLWSGVIAFAFALVLSDYFLIEPLHKLAPIYDLPDFVTFSLAAAGSIWIGCLGRNLAEERKRH